jgi:arsenite-transporting ATPase
MVALAALAATALPSPPGVLSCQDGGRMSERSERILVVTGKGGVGKTTIAAASALRCAEMGKRTLVLSTDPAHSLADAFDVELGDRPTLIASGLAGQQLDTRTRLEDAWADIRDYLTEVFNWAGIDEVEAEELAILPGLDEIFALADIKTHAVSGEWDVIVVDCAPTAETIRFLSLPDVLAWYMERVFPAHRRINRVVSPIVRRLSTIPTAGDEVFAATHRFYDRLEGVRALLTDPGKTSVRLVVNPEKVVVAEARRTYTYLSLFGYRVDAVVANRLLPEGVQDPWFRQWKASHAEHLTEIEEAFAPLPVLRAELDSAEVVGVERLGAFAAGLYGDRDPAARFHRGEPFRIRRKGSGYVLTIELPFAERDEIDLGRRGDDLVVTVGPHRRTIVLPDSLRRRPVAGASLAAGRLTVEFGSDPAVARAKVKTVKSS